MKKLKIILSALACFLFILSPVNTAAADYSDIILTENDEQLIASLCRFETENEPYLSKVCFCAMILNRIQSTCFPDNARSVVFDAGAFESAMQGKLSSNVENDPASTEAMALKIVLRKGVDPTCGALFTMKEDDPTLWQLFPTFKVGSRIFGTAK